MTWITVRELLAIRRNVVAHHDLRRGIHNRAAVYSAVRRPFTAFGGHDLFPTLLEKVAALIHTLIAFHPFLEGNESTALVAADVCLRLNGRRIAPSADVDPFFRAIARGDHEVATIAAWLVLHTEPWTDPALN